jgi:CDP-diacylglycerol--glycerol-3-phosphate 3-phosphatidyltransferase
MPTFSRPMSSEMPSSGARPVPSARQPMLLRLKRQALWHAGGHVMGLVVVFMLLKGSYPLEAALRWLLQAALALAVVHLQLWRLLDQNRRPSDDRLISNLGVANAITLARGWGIALLAGWFGWYAPWAPGRYAWMAWAPGLIYLTAAAADFVDGFWARHTGTETLLGRRLDMETDALGLLVAAILAVDLGRLPFFYLAAGGIYYLFRLGFWCRQQAGKASVPLRERPFARFTAGLQMGFVGIALLPEFATEALRVAAFYFLLPLIIGFIWDWMVVCDRLNQGVDQKWRRALRRTGDIAAAAVRLILLASAPFTAGALLPALPLGAGVVLAVLWLAMVLGWMGRCAALGALCLLAYRLPAGAPPLLFMAALQIPLVLIVIGTGRWSWWRPEEQFCFRKMGRPHSGGRAGGRCFDLHSG